MMNYSEMTNHRISQPIFSCSFDPFSLRTQITIQYQAISFFEVFEPVIPIICSSFVVQKEVHTEIVVFSFLFLSQILGQFIQSSLFFRVLCAWNGTRSLDSPFVNDRNTFQVDIRSMIVKA